MVQDEILEFIHRRWMKDADWTCGNCYWFAKILCERFANLQMWYCPILGHFIAGRDGKFYDWNGIYIPQEQPILFEDIHRSDPLWYERLIQNCAM